MKILPFLGCFSFFLFASLAQGTTVVTKSKEKLTLKSTSFSAGQTLGERFVFKGFGCQGGNISPQLEWVHAPNDTQSFAVTAYDPDAPTGSGWWHWTVVNIPAHITHLQEGAGSSKDTLTNKDAVLPEGAVQGRTDFGQAGYGGPCPPVGDKAHRYIFTVFALKVKKLDIDENASGALVGFMLNQNALAKATLSAKYGRAK